MGCRYLAILFCCGHVPPSLQLPGDPVFASYDTRRAAIFTSFASLISTTPHKTPEEVYALLQSEFEEEKLSDLRLWQPLFAALRPGQ